MVHNCSKRIIAVCQTGAGGVKWITRPFMPLGMSSPVRASVCHGHSAIFRNSFFMQYIRPPSLISGSEIMSQLLLIVVTFCLYRINCIKLHRDPRGETINANKLIYSGSESRDYAMCILWLIEPVSCTSSRLHRSAYSAVCNLWLLRSLDGRKWNFL